MTAPLGRVLGGTWWWPRGRSGDYQTFAAPANAVLLQMPRQRGVEADRNPVMTSLRLTAPAAPGTVAAIPAG